MANKSTLQVPTNSLYYVNNIIQGVMSGQQHVCYWTSGWKPIYPVQKLEVYYHRNLVVAGHSVSYEAMTPQELYQQYTSLGLTGIGLDANDLYERWEDELIAAFKYVPPQLGVVKFLVDSVGENILNRFVETQGKSLELLLTELNNGNEAIFPDCISRITHKSLNESLNSKGRYV